MGATIVVIGLFGALFFASFFTKRHFGVLGLALAAGALLSQHWADMLTPFLENQGVKVAQPPLSVLVQIALILAPPLLLFFSSPTYTKMAPRVIGSLAFALLAMTFLSDILASILLLNDTVSGVFQFLHDHKNELIVAGVVGAIIDVLFSRRSRGHKDGKKG